MPTNPRDRMAELLRACARKRKEQAGAPFELHPATRGMLQAEVARLSPRMKRNEKKATFLSRLIFSAAAAASVIICALILFKNETPAAKTIAAAPAPLLNKELTSGAPGGAILLPSGSASLAITGGGSLAFSPAGAPVAPAPSGGRGLRLSNTTVVFDVEPANAGSGAAADGAGLGTFQSGSGSNAPVSSLTLGGAGAAIDASTAQVNTNVLNGGPLFFGGSQNSSADSAALLNPPEGKYSFDDETMTGSNAYAGAFTLDNTTMKDVSNTVVAAGTPSLKSKLDRIIIPNIDFHDTTLSDAVELLRKKSAELDTTETDPARKGVNIVLNASGTTISGDLPAGTGEGAGQGEGAGGGASVGAFGGNGQAKSDVLANNAVTATSSSNPKITLSLNNVTLSDALNKVAAVAGSKVEVNSGTVNIVPASENADVLLTKEYAVPDGFLEGGIEAGDFDKGGEMYAKREIHAAAPAAAQPAAPAAPAQLAAMDYLKNAGVQFPPGARADYNPSTGKLVVRDTRGNLDAVDKIVEASIDAELGREEMNAKKLAIVRTMQVVNGKIPGPDAVLATFRLQMEGDVIYIVDADGSIYSGKIEQPLLQKVLAVSSGRVFMNVLATANQSVPWINSLGNVKTREQTKATTGAMITAAVSNSNMDAERSRKQAESPGQNFSFRATGINIRMRTPVIFNGNYIVANAGQQQQQQVENQLAAQQDQLKSVKQEANEKLAEKAVPADDNAARIEGQAQVGENGTIDIDAVVVPMKARAIK